MKTKKEKPKLKDFSLKIISQKKKKGNKNMKKIKKRVHFKPFKNMSLTKLVILLSIGIAFIILLHDFIFWAFIPMFTGTFYTLTYTGLFVDLICVFVLESGTQYLKEL